MASSLQKIVSLPALRRRLAALRRRGKTIAFTNGCFDLLHCGHVRYLEAAKRRDRVLVVGLNSDASVRRLKGRGRPVNPARARAAVLAGLASVDFVAVFSADTPERLIRAVRPDVLVKGADWKGQTIAGADFVRARGGRVELVPTVKGFSTTKTIKALARHGTPR